VDTLTQVYFAMFAAGGSFGVLSWLLGARGRHGHVHGGPAAHAHGAAHVHALGAHAHGAAHVHALGAHAHGAGHGHAHGAAHGHAHGAAHAPPAHAAPSPGVLGRALAPLGNTVALAAFACVAGGVGFLARRHGAGAPASMLLAISSGLAAAYAFGALLGWLDRGTRFRSSLPPSQLGRVIARIPAYGTGEISYVLDGARHSLPATAEARHAIEVGTDVVMLEVRAGVARVQVLDEEG
jgi:hypothetical protein